MTTRAENILSAINSIEEWCNNNLQKSSYKVFVLTKSRDPFGWECMIYSVKYNSILFASGDHSRWGAHDYNFTTGMTEKDFEYYFLKSDCGCKANYKSLNNDGNLIFENRLISLIRSWSIIKEELLSMSNDDEFKNFVA